MFIKKKNYFEKRTFFEDVWCHPVAQFMGEEYSGQPVMQLFAVLLLFLLLLQQQHFISQTTLLLFKKKPNLLPESLNNVSSPI